MLPLMSMDGTVGSTGGTADTGDGAETDSGLTLVTWSLKLPKSPKS